MRGGYGLSWWGTKVVEKRQLVTWCCWLPPDNQLLCRWPQKVQTVNNPLGMSVATSDWALTQSGQ